MSLWDLEDYCLFAVPKKGRLNEKIIPLLKKMGLSYTRKQRLDIAFVSNFDKLAIVFLPAHDIALYVSLGRVDMGITGLDIIHESGVEVNVREKLGFGKCRLSIQTPVAKQIKNPEELVGKRIATSFPKTTKEYFDKLNPNAPTTIENLSGSVEIACALGLADAIADLVETGDTMRATGLEEVSTIVHSEAVFITNPHTEHEDIAKKLMLRMKGVLTAEKFVMVEYNIEKSNLSSVAKITPGKTSPTLSPLENPDWVAVKVMVDKDEVNQKLDELVVVGAKDIVVTEIANCRV
eukprot:TRINITY_DN11306_c0_g1_i1.p1 TRINITY_DN11306_c0_g1~~TRINITY_DN11306_c0_g1_i1.p1  ORF type:complete len:293 (-),score=61.11 TRINITY_DN11306_c0_g1_i1:26-904(-)